MNTSQKPRLNPVLVPWMISPSTPFLKLEAVREGEPLRATFVGYFKPDEQAGQKLESIPEIVESVPLFEPRALGEKAAYRMVRVSFNEALHHRVRHAVSDIETIREKDFDWTLVPVKGERETIFEALRRRAEVWLQTGLCPDPRMYEVLDSPWIAGINLQNTLPWHHYMLLGHDEFIEVISRGWAWELGQPIWQ